METTTKGLSEIERPLPQLLVDNDTLGRAYRAYGSAPDKDAFVESVVVALSELNPELNTTVTAQAEVEMWLMENNIVSPDEVTALRAELVAKRAETQAVADTQARTAEYLGMGQR